MNDPREARLRAIATTISTARDLEPERDALLRELARERGRGKLAELARMAGLTRARVHQIIRHPQPPTSRAR